MSTPTWRASFRYGHLVASPPADDPRTSLADANIALSIAAGAPLDDIDPANGDNLSHPAYDKQRNWWACWLRDHPAGLDQYTRPSYQAAHGYWAARRPAYVHDWPVDLNTNAS